MRVPVMRCFGVVLGDHSERISSILGETSSVTGEGFLLRATLFGSEMARYLLTVLRETPISLATERTLFPSTRTLWRMT